MISSTLSPELVSPIQIPQNKHTGIEGLPMDEWPEGLSAPRLSRDKTHYEVMLTESSGVANAGKIWKFYPPNPRITSEIRSQVGILKNIITDESLREDLDALERFCGLWMIEDNFGTNHAARRDFWKQNPGINNYCRLISKMKGNMLNQDVGQGVEFLRRHVFENPKAQENFRALAPQIPDLVNIGIAARGYNQQDFTGKAQFLRSLDEQIVLFLQYIEENTVPLTPQ